MLAIARFLPTTSMSIEWVEASALDLPFPSGCFDLVLCQLGLQFFPDKPRALREMKRVLAASGRIVLSVHSAIERTPGAHAFARALMIAWGLTQQASNEPSMSFLATMKSGFCFPQQSSNRSTFVQ
jgi:ubiquinone/menaquinone biosynthesis C-methylase UbiE